LRTISNQLPYAFYSLISSCPQDTEREVDEPQDRTCEDASIHVFAIFGREIIAFVENFVSYTNNKNISDSWGQMNDFMDGVKKLSQSMSKFAIHHHSLVSSATLLVSKFLDIFGTQFLLHRVFPSLEENIGPSNASLPILMSAYLQASGEEIHSHAQVLLSKWLSYFAETGCTPSESLTVTVSVASSLPGTASTLLVDVLRESVASPVAKVRAECSRLFNVLISSSNSQLSPEIVERRIVPAIISLASDPEDSVIEMSVESLASTLALSGLDWDVSEKVFMQLSSLLEGDANLTITVKILKQVKNKLEDISADVREQLLYPKLSSLPESWSEQISSTKARLIASLLEVFQQTAIFDNPESIITAYLLPSLAKLLELSQTLDAEDQNYEDEKIEEKILIVMSEVEGSRRRLDDSKVKKDLRRESSTGFRRESISSSLSVDSASSPSTKRDQVKEKVNKLFSKPGGGVPFWKK